MAQTSDNPAMQAWQGENAQPWLDVYGQTDRMLEPLGQAALSALDPRAGEWILDIGCGAGTTVLQLAERVGQAGGVWGIDVSELLLARARERCSEAALSNAQFVLADAATHAFERSFDGLYSRFGVMFFAEPGAAFTHLRKALRAGGRLAFVCWQALELNPWALLPLQAVLSAVPQASPPEILQTDKPGPFFLGDRARIHAALQAAGFVDIQIAARTQPIHLGGAETLEAALEYSLSLGPAARTLRELDPKWLPTARDALRDVLAPHTSERGTWMDASVFVVTAHCP